MTVMHARFWKYLHQRGLADTSQSRVFAFLGDGEMDEPESIASIAIAGRENLDNLIVVVNCNLQRLDGPVRGNAKNYSGTRGAISRSRLDCDQGPLVIRMGSDNE